MLCLRKGAKVCGKRTLYFFTDFTRESNVTVVVVSPAIGFGRGIGKQHPGYQIVVVSVLKTIYEERKGKLKRI